LDQAEGSGRRFRISPEDLHKQTIAITSARGDENPTGKLIINLPRFQRKLEEALEFFKPKKPQIGFRKLTPKGIPPPDDMKVPISDKWSRVLFRRSFSVWRLSMKRSADRVISISLDVEAFRVAFIAGAPR